MISGIKDETGKILFCAILYGEKKDIGDELFPQPG
jgi:hypothetical protein